MTLVKKLQLTFAVIIALVLILILITAQQMNRIQEAVNLNIHTFEVIRAANRVRQDLLNIETGQRGFLVTGDEQFLQPYIDGKNEIEKNLQTLQQRTSDNRTQQQRLDNIKQAYQRWLQEAIDPAIAQMKAASNNPEQMNAARQFEAQGIGKKYMDELRNKTDEFLQTERELLDVRSADAANAKSRALWMLILGGVLVVLISVGAGSYLKQLLQSRLKIATQLVASVAQGNLNNRIASDGNDEIAELLQALMLMQTQLHQLLSKIQHAAEALSTASASVASTTEELSASAHEQSRASTSIAASVEELSVSIESVSANSEQARTIANQSGEQARVSVNVINETVTSMTRISDVVRSASDQVEQLGKSSEQISNIVNVIRSIADQTNLLALNAAIEAARAGEQGRGFAVVADEVRLLAQRTGQATNEISTMINTMVNKTNDAVAQMSHGVEQVTQGTALAGEAGRAIEEIQQNFQRVLSVVENISLSLKEQNAASIEVAGHIERIASMSAQNSEATAHSSVVAHDLKALSVELNQSVARFTL
jgi:methyl-accepting chemotaxis protein